MSAVLSNPISIAVPSSFCTVEVERGDLEIIDKCANEWRGLCERSADDQPFFRPEWIRAHIRVFNPGAKLLLLIVRRDGRLCLLLPLIEERVTFSKIPVRRLRSPLSYRGCRFDAACAAGPDGERAMQAAWEYLREQNWWDVLQFQEVQEASKVATLVAAAVASGFHTLQIPERPSPYVPVPPTLELLERLPRSSRLRTKLRQVRRQLADQDGIRFYRLDRADPAALERLYQLEASGWKGRDGGAILCKPETRQFYDEIAEAAAHFGYFALYMLEWKGELLAAHYSLRYKERCYSPIVAYNEDFKEFAPGHLIVSEILKDCLANGISGYDITGQDQEWKMKWTTEVLPISHYYVFKGLLGNLAFRIASGLKRAASPVSI